MAEKARYNTCNTRLENETINTVAELKSFVDQSRSNQVKILRYGAITLDAIKGQITIDDAVDGNEIINISSQGIKIKEPDGSEIIRIDGNGFSLKNQNDVTVINMNLSGMSINDSTGAERMRVKDGKLSIKNSNGDTIIELSENGMCVYNVNIGETNFYSEYINFMKGSERVGGTAHSKYSVGNVHVTDMQISANSSIGKNDSDFYNSLALYDNNIRHSFLQLLGRKRGGSFAGAELNYSLDGVSTIFGVKIFDKNGYGYVKIPYSRGDPFQPQSDGIIYYDESIGRMRIRNSGVNRTIATTDEISPISGFNGIFTVKTPYGDCDLYFQNGIFKSFRYK